MILSSSDFHNQKINKLIRFRRLSRTRNCESRFTIPTGAVYLVRVSGLEFGVCGLGVGVWSLGFGVEGLGFRCKTCPLIREEVGNYGFRVSGLGCEFWGLGNVEYGKLWGTIDTHTR